MEYVTRIVDEQMNVDGETTATQVHVLLVDLGYSLSLARFFVWIDSQMDLLWKRILPTYL